MEKKGRPHLGGLHGEFGAERRLHRLADLLEVRLLGGAAAEGARVELVACVNGGVSGGCEQRCEQSCEQRCERGEGAGLWAACEEAVCEARGVGDLADNLVEELEGRPPQQRHRERRAADERACHMRKV